MKNVLWAVGGGAVSVGLVFILVFFFYKAEPTQNEKRYAEIAHIYSKTLDVAELTFLYGCMQEKDNFYKCQKEIIKNFGNKNCD